MMEDALRYAVNGWPVVPLHNPTGNANQPCSCRRTDCPQKGKHPCHKNTCKEKGKHPCHQAVCESTGKHPRIMEWETKATTDEATIREWWGMWAASNVGIRTGPEFGMVLDVDPRHGGFETLAALEAEHGPLPETRTGDTGGDGAHFVFEYPDFEIKNLTNGELGPGLDVKAAGGQIVAPPSLHPSGKRYRWRNNAPIVKAPDWLLDKLRNAMAKKSATVAGDVGEIITQPGRYAALNSLAGTMRRRGMDAEEIKAALTAVNARRCRPPLDDEKIAYIAESISKHAPASEPETGPPVDYAPEEPEWMRDHFADDDDQRHSEPAKPKEGKSDDQGAFGAGFYSSLRELHAKETVPADDLMIGVRRRQVTIFASVTSVGKTTIMLNHALAAAGGQQWRPLLPDAPDRPLKVVFIDAESTDDELKKDTQTMLQSIGNADVALDNFIPVVDAQIGGEALDLTKPKHFQQIKRFLQYHQPDIAIFDTITALFTLYSENDNAEVIRKVVRPLKELAVAGNCAVWASHHIGKSGESDEAEEAYRGRGASAFGANVRGVITLRKEKALGDGYVRLTLGKSKGSKLDPVNLKLDFAKRTFDICAAAPSSETPYQQVVGKFNGQPLKTQEVKNLLPNLSGRTVEEALKAALKAGDLLQPGRGLYQKPASTRSTPPIGNVENVERTQPIDGVEDSLDFGDWDENAQCGNENGEEEAF